MNDPAFFKKINEEIIADYEEYGKDKPVEAWLEEALKRHIKNITEEETKKTAAEMLEGIAEFRKALGVPKTIEIDSKDVIPLLEVLTDDVKEIKENYALIQEETRSQDSK